MGLIENALNNLSEKLGILDSFCDPTTGIVYHADDESKKRICESLGYKVSCEEEINHSLQRLEEESWRSVVSPTIAVFPQELKPLVFEMCLPEKALNTPVDFELLREDGTSFKGYFNFGDMPFLETRLIEKEIWQKRRVYLFLDADYGYHQIEFMQKGRALAQVYLIVAPENCYMPSFAQKGERIFGFPLQLYALRSQTNWGIGDFSDLERMVKIAPKLGVALIGVNPLNALFPDSANEASPYCASSRLFLNSLYVDLDKTPEAKLSEKYKKLKDTPSFQNALNKARAHQQVQYETVAKLKEKAFELLYKTFLETHFDKNKKPITARGKKYLSFYREKGKSLQLFACYHLLRRFFLSKGESAVWNDWPKDFQNPESKAVHQFIQTHEKEIGLICYRQFVAFEQYEKVVKSVQKSGMQIGLYTDLPVGVSANSAEVWSNQKLFMPFVTTGAPPDSFNQKGQDWSLAPFNPRKLAETGFKAYQAVIAHMMRGAGAMRLDHAFGLERLYLRVPKASGAYLKYPYKILMAIIALESHRNQCLVIAEDLGTPPIGFSDKMRFAKALSFKIMHFQQETGGKLLAPQQYDYLSLVATGTHDMASYTGFWKELDLELEDSLNTITKEQYQAHKLARTRDKEAFIDAFYRQNLPMPERAQIEVKASAVPDWLIENTYAFLSRANSMILLVRLEDLLAQDEQINLPGTYLEYPNWRYKLPVAIDKIADLNDVQKICALISKERLKK